VCVCVCVRARARACVCEDGNKRGFSQALQKTGVKVKVFARTKQRLPTTNNEQRGDQNSQRANVGALDDRHRRIGKSELNTLAWDAQHVHHLAKRFDLDDLDVL
jgi:hypothetical protein